MGLWDRLFAKQTAGRGPLRKSAVAFLFLALLVASLAPFQTVYASGGLDWEWLDPRPLGNRIVSIIYAENQFVAVGEAELIMTSPDGIDWEVQRSNYGTDAFDILTITHANGQYLALGRYQDPSVGKSGVDIFLSLTSEDGKSWKIRHELAGSLTMDSLTADRASRTLDVAYDGVQYVVKAHDYVPHDPEFWVSPDGIQWTKQPDYDPTLFPLYHPTAPGHYAFGNGIYVSVTPRNTATGDTVYISRDGHAWQGQPTSAWEKFSSVAFGNGLFVAPVIYHGETGYIATSEDGRNWSKRHIEWVKAEPSEYDSVAHGEGVTVAGGWREVVVFDAQGQATPVPVLTDRVDRLLYAKGHFIALSTTGCPGLPHVSPDGYQWNPIVVDRPLCVDRMVATDDEIVMLGLSQGKQVVVTSNDLQNWTIEPTNLPYEYGGSLAWGDGTFITVQRLDNYTAGIWVSKDGRSWVQGDPKLPAQLKGISFVDGRFLALGTGGSYSSEDGFTWTFATGNPPEFRRVAYSGEYYMAVGPKTIGLSTNGTDWVTENYRFGVEYHDVIFTGDRFIVAANDRLLSAKIPACRKLFLDVPASHPACEPIDQLSARRVISGYSDHTFRPSNQVTRAEIAKMVTVALGQYPNPTGRVTFQDVAGHWSLTQGYLQKAVELGVITGYSPQAFGPNDPLTRAQLIKITATALGLSESGTPSHTGVPGWANGWVAAAEKANVIGAQAPFPIWTEGDLNGDAPVTRAEAATLLANMLELKK